MNRRFSIPAFSAYGIELEYAIVDRDSLAVRPIAEELLRAFAGEPAADVERSRLGWSNELVAHVVEMKNLAPTPALETLAHEFQAEVRAANRALAPLDARLMPTAMHPWMEPREETVLWTREGGEIYRAYDRIFDCRAHGWSNIQSMHINLPFADDDEFARLHAATRLVLPLLPALAASSPIVECRATGFMDYRLDAYRRHARAVPTVAGKLIPDTVVDRADYETRILEPIYREIESRDPDGVLRHEWLNARAAIARFDRNAIELRLADTQECPLADVAIAAATVAVVRAIYDEKWSTLAQQQALSTDALRETLHSCVRTAEETIVDDAQLLEALGIASRWCPARDVWRRLIAAAGGADAWWHPRVSAILDRGTLARRILNAVGGDFSRERLHEVYERLCRCLDRGVMFE
jgi:gamma-glutamyl:cysteine ligase YbdK (ATP-grasp superfamily)